MLKEKGIERKSRIPIALLLNPWSGMTSIFFEEKNDDSSTILPL